MLHLIAARLIAEAASLLTRAVFIVNCQNANTCMSFWLSVCLLQAAQQTRQALSWQLLPKLLWIGCWSSKKQFAEAQEA